MNLQYERMLALCDSLNLPFVAQNYVGAAQEAAAQESAYSDFLEALLKAESAGRQVRKQSLLTRLAGFPAIKTLEEFDYAFAAGVKRSQIDELAGLAFVERNENVVLVGPPGWARPISRSPWAIAPRKPVSRPVSRPPPISC